MAEGPDLRSILKDNAARLIPVLVAVAAAPVLALVADVPTWTSAISAGLAVVSLILLVLWIGRPWSEWTARRGRRLVAVVVPLVAAGLVLIAGVIAAPPTVDPSKGARLILFDTSREMRQPLPGGTQSRLEDAMEQMGSFVSGNAGEQLGLATFGNGCGADPPIVEEVGIAEDRADEITTRLGGLEATSADRNLVTAASFALSLLEPFDEGEYVKLVIVTSGLDQCDLDIEDFFANLQDRDIELDWFLIGMGFSAQDKAQASQLSGGQVLLVDTPGQLGEALNEALCKDWIRSEFADVRDVMLSQLPERLNETAETLQVGDVGEAQTTIDEVRRLVGEGEKRFAGFETEGPLAYLQELKIVFGHVLERLKALATELDELIAFREGHPGALTGEALTQWNELVGAYNDLVVDFNDVSAEVAEQIELLLERGCS